MRKEHDTLCRLYDEHGGLLAYRVRCFNPGTRQIESVFEWTFNGKNVRDTLKHYEELGWSAWKETLSINFDGAFK